MLHEQLAPYLWPASQDARAFWDRVEDSRDAAKDDVFAKEAALWDIGAAAHIITSAQDVNRALSLLAGFNMLTPIGGGEFAVPTLLSKERRSGPVLLPSVDKPIKQFTRSLVILVIL